MTRSPRQINDVSHQLDVEKQRYVVGLLAKRSEYLNALAEWKRWARLSYTKKAKKILGLRKTKRFIVLCLYLNYSRQVVLSTEMLEGIDLRSAAILAYFWPSFPDLLERLKNRPTFVQQLLQELRTL